MNKNKRNMLIVLAITLTPILILLIGVIFFGLPTNFLYLVFLTQPIGLVASLIFPPQYKEYKSTPVCYKITLDADNGKSETLDLWLNN